MLLTNASPRYAEFARQVFLHVSAYGRHSPQSAAFMSRSHLPGALMWRNRFRNRAALSGYIGPQVKTFFAPGAKNRRGRASARRKIEKNP